MPNFKVGELVLLKLGTWRSASPDLLKYDGTILELLKFKGSHHTHEGVDWWKVASHDGRIFFAREGTFYKLPPPPPKREETTRWEDVKCWRPRRLISPLVERPNEELSDPPHF